MHKAQFRAEKLADHFPDTIHYFCEKVAEGVGGGVTGPAGLTMIKSAFAEFRAAALRRNPALAERLDYEYATVAHAVEGLERYFAQGEGEPLTARIFVDHLSARIATLKQFAQEIDDEYAAETCGAIMS